MIYLNLVLALVLVLRGVWMSRRGPTRLRGLATLLFSALGALVAGMAISDRFLLAPEIDVAFVEGLGLEYLGLLGALLLLAWTSGLGVLVVHARHQPALPARARWGVLGAATLCAGASITRVRVLNPEDLEAFQIYALDLLFPPLVLWVGGCCVAAGVLTWRSSWRPGIWIGGFAALLGLYFILSPRPFDDPWSEPLWRLVVLAAVLRLGFAGWSAWRGGEPAAGRDRAEPAPEPRRALWTLANVLVLATLFPFCYVLARQGILDIRLQWIATLYLVFWWLAVVEISWKDLPHRLVDAGTQVRRRVGWLTGLGRIFRLDNWPRAIFATVALVLLLFVLGEIVISGRTIIQPFRDRAIRPGGDVGASISEQLSHRLLWYNERFSSTAIPVAMRDAGGEIGILSGDVGDTGAMFTESRLQFGEFSLPIDPLLKIIRMPLRAVLGTETITGSLEREGSSYKLLAVSSAGKSWIVRTEIPEEMQAREESPPRPSVEDEDVVGQDAEPLDPQLAALIARLTEEMAFQIYISTSQSLQHLGMTRSWEAFEDFWTGLNARDGDKLLDATRKDPSFALAHYHLGLLRFEEGKYPDAIASFRSTLQHQPDFVPALNALANALGKRARDLSEEDHDQIRGLLQRVLLFRHSPGPSRAAAYAGLSSLKMGNQARYLDWRDPPDLLGRVSPELRAHRRSNTLAVFYARRAEALYRDIRRRSADPVGQMVRLHVEMLNQLGQLLEQRYERPIFIPPGQLEDKAPPWSCRGEILFTTLPDDLAASLNELIELVESDGATEMTERVTESATSAETTEAEREAEDEREEAERKVRQAFRDARLPELPEEMYAGKEWKLIDAQGAEYVLLDEGEGFGFRVYGWSLSEGPHLSTAARLYRRALRLKPDDPATLCNLAAYQYVTMDNPHPMSELLHDAQTRLALADRYQDHYNRYDRYDLDHHDDDQDLIVTPRSFYIYRRAFNELEAAYGLQPDDETIERFTDLLALWTKKELLSEDEAPGLGGDVDERLYRQAKVRIREREQQRPTEKMMPGSRADSNLGLITTLPEGF